MEVVYSINSRLAGGGTGNTAYHAVRGPAQAGYLKRVICSSYQPREIPDRQVRSLGTLGRIIKRIAAFDHTGRFNDWSDRLFDRWSSHVLERCDVLHCWSDLRRTLMRGKALGATTVLECMLHPKALEQILLEESSKWGVHSDDLPSQGRLERSLAEIDAADFISVPSEFNRLTHVAHGVPAGKVRVAPYGVDTRRFVPSTGPIEHAFRVLFVGHVSLRKGAPYALEAWRQLNWHDAELWLLGAITSEMRHLMPRWSHLPGVKWLGYHPNSVELYQQSDVFLLPTLGEGSALVTYEAMACGLPLVVTNSAGSIARHEVDGFVIEPRSVDSIAGALDRLRSSPALRRQMSCNAREHVGPYTWRAYGERLVHLYRELVPTVG